MLQELDLQNRTWCIEQIHTWYSKGALLLDAPYQRGIVWGVKRQQNFIRSILAKIPFPSLVINNRDDADFEDGSRFHAVIDGKQRITTILNFMSGDLGVPAEWFGDPFIGGLVRFYQLPNRIQNRMWNRRIAVVETCLSTLEEEKQVFDLINFGGLAQGESDRISMGNGKSVG